MKSRMIAAVMVASMLGGCAAAGIGENGRNFKLSQAEPLFGTKLDKCLDDPATLLGIASTDKNIIAADCEALANELRPVIYQIADSGSFDVERLNRYDKLRRNEIIDALVAVSNRKCSDYAAFLKTHDGQANASLSILSILTGGLGGFIGGADTAKALSGSSSILSGSRAALNDTWFSNQTIHVLVSGFEKVRERDLREITNRKDCQVEQYSVMAGVGDALKYHGACSLLTGLSEAAQAIDRADQPGLETMRRQLSDLQSISAQASQLINASYSFDPVREAPLRQSVNVALQLLNEERGAVNAARDRLDRLRTEAAAALDDEAKAAFAEDIDSLQAEVAGREATVARYAASYQQSQAKLDEFLAADVEARQKKGSLQESGGNPVGSKSNVAICPFTGMPAGRDGGGR